MSPIVTRLGVAGLVAAILMANVAGARRADVATLAGQLTRASVWTAVGTIRVDGRIFHPQGMVKIGDDFFVSSVEVTEAPERFERLDAAGFDRTPGVGVGHVFRITRTGRLAADTVVGEGAMYHPGGMDFDGRYLWVPVAEYRPNSRSILYRVNPTTMQAVEVRRVSDHIGAVAVARNDGVLHGVSWGSRRFYQWPLPPVASAAPVGVAPVPPSRDNPSHYVDYQDCKYVGLQRMLCTGLAEVDGGDGAAALTLGGLDLVSLADGRPLRQVPVTIRTASGRVLTQNPSFFEATPEGLRAYFMPDDDPSAILAYLITPRDSPRP